jgi:hypothetical protein
MKTYVVTAALIVAFAIPALAGSGAYYVGLRLGGGYCMVMTHAPSPKKYKMMGKYGTRAEAQKAMQWRGLRPKRLCNGGVSLSLSGGELRNGFRTSLLSFHLLHGQSPTPQLSRWHILSVFRVAFLAASGRPRFLLHFPSWLLQLREDVLQDLDHVGPVLLDAMP